MEPRLDLFASPTAGKALKRFANAAMALERSTLPKTLRELVQLRVGQINGCGLCVDAHSKEAAAAGETPVRINLVAVWRESTVFTEPERAALALAEEGTRLGDGRPGVAEQTWAAAREHYDDDQLGTLVCLIAMINAATRMNVMVHNPGSSYEPGTFAAVGGE
ncbi:alkyl hydroperoxide reductase AhpD [Actinocatenispora thailandica]|uniref:Alkyl hydroperoxide reductase AhpD n=1 Tax=Actinocatenispora thailandica TaxID=227318 RepID=A0A7R7DN27_9ACTN|nr:carboxymuconolactone decarboxylase family protein [Actinocatenispora thailandica]BCJ34397.1 alkyl hydroperoxide reductase AhpD [Actinocatenispora thailandica]